MSANLCHADVSPPQYGPCPVAENRTGGGGGLYSDSEKGEKTVSSSSSGESNQEQELASTLRDLGVFLLAPPKRTQVARQLASAGVTAQGLLDLAAFVAESESDESRRRRYLAAVVTNAEVAVLALRDVQHYRSKATQATQHPGKPAAAVASVGGHDGGARLRAENMERVRRFEAEFAAAVARGEVSKRRDPHPWERR